VELGDAGTVDGVDVRPPPGPTVVSISRAEVATAVLVVSPPARPVELLSPEQPAATSAAAIVKDAIQVRVVVMGWSSRMAVQ